MKIDDLNDVQELSRDEMKAITGGVTLKVQAAKTAWRIGYAIGTVLDNATGLSDKISGTDDHLIVTKEVKNAGNIK